MKLIAIFLWVACLHASASGISQQVTLSGKSISLSDAFKEIKKQTGYLVFYRADVVGKLPGVSIRANKMPLKQFLSELLKEVSLTYTIKQNTITISEKSTVTRLLEETTLALQAVTPPPVDVTGQVVDSTGLPLASASVRVKRSGKVVQTSTNGSFVLTGLQESDVLEISYIGYDTKLVRVTAGQMIVKLEPVSTKLDELLIIGYGNTTRRMSTGSTGRVTGDEIIRQPVSNPIVALEGKVPGLFITQNAGYAGANMAINIRGKGNLALPSNQQNPTAPLYIIDGVPFNSNPVEMSIGGFSITPGFSPLNTVNPADIESIDVLKDADATAIYGSRGANGVILITTRKGKPGATRVTVDFSQGLGKASNQMKLLNTQEYLAIRKQAFANDNITPTAANAPDLVTWDQNAYTNFPKLLIGNTSHQTNAGISLSGGDSYTQFVLSGTYRRENTVYYSRSDDKAAQFRLALQHKNRNNRFATDVSVSYNNDNNTIPNYSMSVSNYGLAPNYPLYNADGSLYFGPGFTNPLAAFNATNNLKTSNLNANAGMRYTVLPGLDVKLSGGYNLTDVKGTLITPASANNPANNFPQSATFNNNYVKTYIAEPQLTYKLTTGKGRLNAILGGTWQQTQTVQPFWIIGNFTNIQLVNSLGALTLLAKSSGYTDYRYTSGFGRVEYVWNDKYLFSGNIRRDGSSRFGNSNRFGNFGSVAGAWIFSKENWLSDRLSWLSFGKLRASYGTVGSDLIPDYSYLSNYAASGSYGPLVTLVPARIANPSLQWEQTKKLDIALELGFVQDRILLTATYYRNRSSHLLGNMPLAGQAGFANISGNLDAVIQNKGVELELRTSNIQNGRLRWTSSVNLTMPQNKLLSFPGLLNSTYNNTYVVGESINLSTVYRFGGFVNDKATLQDVNGDGVITAGINANGKGDYIVSGNNDPKLYGGFSNTLTYKGFQLDVFFQGIKRTAFRGDFNFGAYPGTANNIPKSLLDVGFKYSSNTSTPSGSTYFNYLQSDAAIEDASFLRLKNVSLAYNVPAGFCRKLGMSSLQVYARGQNLLTFTSYKGLDPETLSTQVPTMKMFVAGLRTTF